MNVWNIQKLHLTIVSVLLLIPLSCQHVTQGCVIAPSVVNLNVVLLVNLLCFADEV